MSSAIRPLALAIIWRGEDELLVFEAHNPLTGRPFHRPLGGGIEYGERGHETIVREMREELNAELADVRYLATVENIFTYEGALGHEIVLLYEARLVDESFYAQEEMVGVEGEETFRVVWKSLAGLRRVDAPPLYPDGLLELLG